MLSGRSVSVTTQVQWQAIQERIWACETCKDHARVEINLRQQTPAGRTVAALLFVGVAPVLRKNVIRESLTSCPYCDIPPVTAQRKFP